jgi:hypothetical protein
MLILGKARWKLAFPNIFFEINLDFTYKFVYYVHKVVESGGWWLQCGRKWWESS